MIHFAEPVGADSPKRQACKQGTGGVLLASGPKEPVGSVRTEPVRAFCSVVAPRRRKGIHDE
jgi:hypothetical protein